MKDNIEIQRELNGATPKTLRLVMRENERVDVVGPVTIIANRKADLIFKGDGEISRRYSPEDTK